MLKTVGIWVWVIVDLLTFGFLMYEKWPDLNWWNWLVVVPVNIFLSTIWPIYWVILRPIFGG